MHLQKLVSTLQAIDKATAKRFSDYMDSPYFHHASYTVELWEYLLRHYPNYTARNVSVAAIAAKCAKLKTKQTQSRAGSELLTCFEHFAALEQWQQNGHEVNLQKVWGLKNMGLPELAREWYDDAMNDLKEDVNQHIEVMQYKHLLEETRLNGFDAKLKRTNQNDIAPVLKTLDEYYALKKLRYQCEAISRNKIFGTALPPFNEAEILEILKPYTTPKSPYIFVFVAIYKMLLETDYEAYSKYYNELKDFVAGGESGKPLQTVVEACEYAVNLSVQWINRGFETASAEYLWWMEWKMMNGIFIEEGKLLPATYRNIASNAVLTNKPVDWLADFIKTYTPLLPEQFTAHNEGFALGLLHYAKQEYKRAIQCLQTAQAKDDVLFNAVIRRWQFICLYEYDPEDKKGLLNALEAFAKYLSRNKEGFAHYGHLFKLFIKYAEGLVASVDYSSDEKLAALLSKEPYFPGKKWIMNRLELLHKKARTKIVQAV